MYQSTSSLPRSRALFSRSRPGCGSLVPPISPTVPSGLSGYGPEPLPMTFLPVLTLRVAPAATEKAPSQGFPGAPESPGNYSGRGGRRPGPKPPALPISDTRSSPVCPRLACPGNWSQDGGSAPAFAAGRSGVYLHEGAGTRPPPRGPKNEEEKKEPPSRNRSKTVSLKKGDVINRYKTKASSDEERTSDEEADSSDDEEGAITYHNHAKGGPLGRRVRGFVELQTRLPKYKGQVSNRSYRLKGTEAVVDENDTGKVNGIL
jgi:hypothetical protein